ncbi:uncharacterized protein LOC142602480 [Balearica regulorum gibbericeps]|uniref:uncharacterized protein LOC142602480 n=1 Tax=Balearica regulorum gibbericeps TaxID=100784 RepID=UPI003F60B243
MGSGSAQGPVPPGSPGVSAEQVDFVRGGVAAGPRSPRNQGSRVGRTHGLLSTGLPVEEISLEILTPLLRPCKAGPALVLSGVRVTGGGGGGAGCSGRRGPGNGLATRVPSRRPQGTATRGRRFSFFLFDANSEHPSPSLPNPPPHHLAAHPRSAAARLPALGAALAHPGARQPRAAPALFRTSIFVSGRSDLRFRNDVSNAGHQGKEQIPGFTHEAVCTHPCQTPAHFKCQHVRRKREKIPELRAGAVSSAVSTRQRTSPGRTAPLRRASPHTSPARPLPVPCPSPARSRPPPVARGAVVAAAGAGPAAHPRGDSAPCRPSPAPARPRRRRRRRQRLGAGPGCRPGTRRQLPVGDLHGEKPQGALRPLIYIFIKPIRAFGCLFGRAQSVHGHARTRTRVCTHAHAL